MMRPLKSITQRTSLVATMTLSAAGGCATDPFTSGPGNATVTGLVTDASGLPLSGTTVRIACTGGAAVVVIPTDSTGHYLTNLSAPAEALHGMGGGVVCHLTEPAAGLARVQVDTTLGFSRGPVLVPLQRVNLHEP
jgi:hypothetical protein